VATSTDLPGPTASLTPKPVDDFASGLNTFLPSGGGLSDLSTWLALVSCY
jgi:hypothetical protein